MPGLYDKDCRRITRDAGAETGACQRQWNKGGIYELVNNRAEGNAPLTVQALVDQLSNSDEPGMAD